MHGQRWVQNAVTCDAVSRLPSASYACCSWAAVIFFLNAHSSSLRSSQYSRGTRFLPHCCGPASWFTKLSLSPATDQRCSIPVGPYTELKKSSASWKWVAYDQ